MIHSRLKNIYVLLGAALLVACGGGGASSPQLAGITGVGFAQGAVTGFGSIFVNGVEFSTSSAQIRIDGQAAAESQLKIGQVVTVKGVINSDGTTGRADEVNFNHNVEGPIQSIDFASSSLLVLGQTVIVNGGSTFEGVAGLSDLVVGAVVEVSGFPNAMGAIVASHIEVRTVAGELEVNGKVANLDANAKRFGLNALTVDYSAAQLFNGSPADGSCVEVKGTAFANGVLTATTVEVKDCNLTVNNGDVGEIEGVISRFTSSSDFEIAGQRIITNSQTQFSGGVAADLRLDLKVEAEGSFDTSGVLTARKVQIKTDSSARLIGTVDAVDGAARSLTVFGISVQTSSTGTVFDDKSNAKLRPFGISDLRTGDYVEVRGAEAATAGTLTAVLVERRDLSNKRELRAVARNVAQPNLTLLGVSVVAAGNAEYRDAGDAAISATDFFAQAADSPVKVRGSYNGGVFTADQLELENP